MSNVVSASDPLTSTEIALVAGLNALAISPTGTAIAKTGQSSFANVAVGSGGGLTRIPVTGSVNGLNGTYVALETLPTWLVIDGAWYEQADGNGISQWSAAGLVITTKIIPNNAIWGF